jgi:hypothetical protein
MALKRPEATHPRMVPSLYLLSEFLYHRVRMRKVAAELLLL